MALTKIQTAGITDGTVGADDLASTLDLSGKTVTLPEASVTAHVTAFDDNQLKEEIALLGFKVAANGSLSKYNLVDQTIDDFQDATGVDAGASTNEARDSAGKYYKGETTATPSVSGDYDDSGVDGDYSWYKWTTVTSSGTYTTDNAQDYEYLVVAGGGAGGGCGTGGNGGGGGAGGFRTATGFAVAATTISGITVGAGGIGTNFSGVPGTGGDSVFSSITSTGGGGGGDYNSDATTGGSGGGGTSGASGSATGASGTVGQGNAGGNAYATGATYGAGGGGGAGAIGGNGGSTDGGNGGNGTANSITGASVTYAGGGGGGADNTGTAGTGGTGGGGAGCNTTQCTATSGTANTGGGGGGAGEGGGSAGGTGGTGGTGIVVIRRATASTAEGANLTLVSTTTTAQVAPTKADFVMTYTNGAGTATVNTDLKAYASRDDGTTWTRLTLASQGSTGAHTILSAHDLDISGQPSGTDMRYKITTHNQSATKATRIHAVSLGWA